VKLHDPAGPLGVLWTEIDPGRAFDANRIAVALRHKGYGFALPGDEFFGDEAPAGAFLRFPLNRPPGQFERDIAGLGSALAAELHCELDLSRLTGQRLGLAV
jgi:hypothetical protein